MNSASLCSLAGRYDNLIPPRFLAPIDFLKIPAVVRATRQEPPSWHKLQPMEGAHMSGLRQNSETASGSRLKVKKTDIRGHLLALRFFNARSGCAVIRQVKPWGKDSMATFPQINWPRCCCSYLASKRGMSNITPLKKKNHQQEPRKNQPMCDFIRKDSTVRRCWLLNICYFSTYICVGHKGLSFFLRRWVFMKHWFSFYSVEFLWNPEFSWSTDIFEI